MKTDKDLVSLYTFKLVLILVKNTLVFAGVRITFFEMEL